MPCDADLGGRMPRQQQRALQPRPSSLTLLVHLPRPPLCPQVAVSLLPPLPSAPEIWRLAASVNGRSLSAGTTTTPTGIRVTFSDGGIGKFGTAKVEAGFITISMIQK